MSSAGTVGFEPTVRITPARLTVLCRRPLGHIPVNVGLKGLEPLTLALKVPYSTN